MRSPAVRRQCADVFASGPICSSASRFSVAAAAAAVVHSSNSHCLVHTSFGTPNSCPGYRGSTTVATTYRRSSLISYGETKQTSKSMPPPTYYVVVQLISRANACRYHWCVNWKRHTESWNLTLIDETGSVFSKHTSKPPIARSQFRHAIRIPVLVAGRVNKGNDREEMGRGQLASALSRRRYTSHTCSLHDETRLEYRPHFFSWSVNASCLLASLAESDYCLLLAHLVSAETVLAYTSVQWMNTDHIGYLSISIS